LGDSGRGSAFEPRPPVAERLERNLLSLAILPLIQLAMAPRLMVRSPKSLAVNLATQIKRFSAEARRYVDDESVSQPAPLTKEEYETQLKEAGNSHEHKRRIYWPKMTIPISH
jgi:hypothetical protein